MITDKVGHPLDFRRDISATVSTVDVYVHEHACLWWCTILPETDRLVVCGGALKFSLSDRGLWDTSVSHCLLCLVFTPLRRVYTAVASSLASSKSHETYREFERERQRPLRNDRIAKRRERWAWNGEG